MSDLKDLNGFDNEENEELYETIIMTDDEGNEVEFIVVDSAEDSGNSYLLVIEAGQDEEDEDDVEAFIFKETQENDESYVYDIIEDEKEFERIAALFQSSGDDYDIELD